MAVRRKASPERALRWALLLPASLLTGFGIVMPLAAACAWALRRQGAWSFENYRTVLTELPYVPVLANTLLISGLVCLFSVGLAFAVCMQFARSGPRTARLFIGSLTLIIAISVLVKNYALQVILAYNGPLNDAMLGLGLFDHRQRMLYTKPAVIVAMVQFLTPYAALILYGAIRRIDYDIVLATRTLGAGPLTTFRSAVWPQVKTSVLMVSVLIFSIAMGFFVTPALLGGPTDRMIGTQMHTDLIYNRSFGSGLAAAQGMVLTAILGVVALIAFLLAGSGFLNASDDRPD
jgi:ABC-type spermidine/putrescine transport system permease subunit I